MLYPIELLGLMTGTQPSGVATDGVHVNGRGEFCHVVRQLFRRKPSSRPASDKPSSTGLTPYRAKCISAKCHHCILQ